MEDSTPVVSETHLEENKLQKISYWILGFLTFLLPFFFVPSSLMPLQVGKGVILVLAVIASAIFFIISIIRDGKISIPKNLLFLSILLLPLVFLLSALINGGGVMSFLGYSLEVGSVAFIFLASALLFLVSESFQTKERVFYAYIAFFGSFVVIALFQLIRLFFGPGALSFGVFQNPISNLVGSWNDLGIFFGAMAILAMVTLEMVQLKRLFKVLAYVVLVVSALFLILVNFITIWLVVAILSLIFFVYVVSSASYQDNNSTTNVFEDSSTQNRARPRKISYHALALLALSVIFLIGGQVLGQKVSEAFNISNIEVRPSWSSTLSIVGQSVKENPFLGSGPNTFSQSWLVYKPSGINETIFWNTDFSSGIGLIPSFFATTGVLGILSWLFFFVMFIWVGVRSIFYQSSTVFSRYLTLSSFIVSLFLWIMSVVYVPSLTIVSLAFLFTGIFIATLRQERLIRTKDIVLSDHPKASFISVIVLVVSLIALLTLGYFIVQKTVSLFYFQKSLNVLQENQDVEGAETEMIRAIGWGEYDIFYRALSEINLIKVNELLNRPGATPESIRDEFQLYVGNAIENARKASELNPNNHQNWITLAQVYAALVPDPFRIPGAYDNAKTTYERALSVAPSSPAIPLLLARLEVANGDLEKAEDYANQSIALKRNYAEGHFLLAQIAITQGNVNSAIPALETTVILSPNNPGLLFQLGLLKYSIQDYAGAGLAFAEAIRIVPEYANAQYFLGLSLYQLDQKDLAIAQFEILKASNPDNTELDIILENMRAGKAPFENVPPPQNSPETRPELPIEETN